LLKVEITSAALPLESSATLANVVVSSLNVTTPVGVPDVVEEIVAVKVMD